MMRINRLIDPRHVGLACAHVTLAPLSKGPPPVFLPCHGCQEGRATDFDYLKAAFCDQRREDRERLRALVEATR